MRGCDGRSVVRMAHPLVGNQFFLPFQKQHAFHFLSFLDASLHLYNRVCPFVDPSVRLLVMLSLKT